MHASANQIWQLGAAQLARQIAARELSANEVVAAHIARIEQVNPRLNATAEQFFDEARNMARRLDDDASLHAGQPLRGVPISIKECFHVRGGLSTIGLSTCTKASAEDGILVDRLRQAGAIIVATTNVPQLMLIHETRNPIYGVTRNPWNLARMVGGSSGGEAALIAAGGSTLGLGSDLGGSIRIPAHFCGICGIKPTSRRLTRSGSTHLLKGMETLEFQPGPMARHIEDLRIGLRVLLRDRPVESWKFADDPPVGLQSSGENISGMRIGLIEDDGFFAPCPAVRRALREGAEGLRQRGATIVSLDPLDTTRLLKLYFGIASADGGQDMRSMMRGAKPDAEVTRLIRLASIPRWLRPFLAAMVLRIRGKHKMSTIFKASGLRSASSLWKLTCEAHAAIEQLFADWDRRQLDAILCPVHATPAMLPDTAVDMLPAASMSMVMNLLGVPSGTVPATRVRHDEQSDRDPDVDASYRIAQRIEQGSTGLPVGVQVVGRMWREDQVLSVMEALEEHYRGLPDFPDITSLPALETA